MVESRRRIDGIQQVLNTSWPLKDDDGPHARGIKDQEHPIPVRVRLVFEHDGEELLPGTAQRWTKTHVYVRVGDPRMQVAGVWVLAEDVRRG
ncbi:hypothetical protein [Nocardioides sp. SYSU DS0663]|uniref:hypothetical protein n=1 Tax=Nocardioides sp. SYSU DS0663 TaxID=3416445 RepID=UPI003F4C233B